MVTIERPTETKYEGPWLISHTDFIELTNIIEKCSSNIKNDHAEQIRDIVNWEIEKQNLISSNFDEIYKDFKQKYDSKIIEESKFFTEENITIKAQIISGGLVSEELNYNHPKSFTYNYTDRLENTLKISLCYPYNNVFSYEIKCYNKTTEDTIKYELNEWVEKHKPSFINRNWGFLSGFIFMVCLALGIFIVGTSYQTYTYNYDKVYKIKIDSLLEKGIDSSNNFEALNYFYKLNVNYTPAGKEDKNKISYGQLAFGLSFLIIGILVSRVNINSIIGIGKNKKKYKSFKFWEKLFTITIPIYVILPLIKNFILSKI